MPFPDPAHPAHQEALEHLGEIRAQLQRLAEEAGADDSSALADELLMIIDGMYANGAVLGPSGPAQRGVAFAADRIRERIAGSDRS